MARLLALLICFSFAPAEAAPRYFRPQRPLKCERVLVNEDLQNRVSEHALQIAEWTGEVQTLNLIQLEELMAQLRQMVVDVRGAYTVSSELAEERLAALTAAVQENQNRIREAIAEARFPKASRPAPAVIEPPGPSMSHESGPTSFGWDVQWPPNSNDKP